MLEAIKKEINKNSLEIENVTPYNFETKAKEIYDNLFENYINYINTAIIEYGDTKSNYKNNLDRIIEQNQNNIIRRLAYPVAEKEYIEETKKRIESKYVEDSLEQIVNKTRNVKQYISILYAFTENEKIIKNYKNNLNIDNKKIKETIALNKYNEQIDTFLKEKLSNITNVLIDYYDSINSTFSFLKNELLDSMNNINKSLNNITELTKEILNGKYEKISDSTNRINKTRTNYIEEYEEDLNYVQKSENMKTNVVAYINRLTEYAEFKLEFILEGTKFKIPKIKAKIIDKTIPKNVLINVLSEYGFCNYKEYQFDIEFNNATYTSNIEYDIKSSYINITTYKDIGKYEYKIKLVETKGEMRTESINVENYNFIIKQPICVSIIKILVKKPQKRFLIKMEKNLRLLRL